MMSIAFEVDCGEVISGHRLLARGLRDEEDARRPGGRPRNQSLCYALVPGLGSAELGVGDGVDFRVWFERRAHRSWSHRRRTHGGFLDARPDQPETIGELGPFAVPRRARRVGAVVVGIHAEPVSEHGVSVVRHGPDHGSLVVDMTTGAAVWEPARRTGTSRPR